MTNTPLPPDVSAWMDQIPPEHRPLFDTLHALITSTLPDAEVVISYKMPSYKIGKQRVSLARWKHGITLCTTVREPVDQFRAQHPEFTGGTVTVQFTPEQILPIAALTDLVTRATTK